MNIDKGAAVTYAGWFKSLSDPTRVMILNRLANSQVPLSVGELVREVNVSQPTVSHHLNVLADVGFVLVEYRANQSLYRVNERCLRAFPSAAELVMGHLPAVDGDSTCVSPWVVEREQASEPSTTERPH